MKLGWKNSELCFVANIGAGNPAPKKSELDPNSSIPFIRTSDVGQIKTGTIFDSRDHIPSKVNLTLKVYPRGTILFPKSGASTYLNHRVQLGVKSAIASHLAGIKAKDEIMDDRYLFYFLHTIDARKLNQDSEYPSLNLSRLNAIRVNYPSLAEQKRIVKVLDATFSKIDRLEAIAKRNIENNQEIVTQVVNKAFNEPLSHWQKVSLEQVCEIKSVLVDPREEQYCDLPHIGAGNIVSNSTDLKNIKTAKEEGLKSAKFPFDTSMVLYSKIRPYLMKVAIPDFEGICSADMYPLSPHEQLLDKEFLFYLLLSKNFTDYAISGSGRAGMPKVNRSHLFKYEFNIPTLNEQRVLVRKWNALSQAVSKKKSIIVSKQADLSDLKQSILAKAFTGDLIDMFPAKNQKSSEVYFSANDNYDLHAATIAYADSYFRNNAPDTFHGRTIFEKVAQAAETIARIELGRQAVQGMRGPTDDKQRDAVEVMASEKGYFSFESTGGKGMKLKRGRNFSELRLSFEQKFEAQIPALDKFLRLIAPMPTRDVEVLSTVYTAWNNYLIEEQEPTDEQIVYAAREGWHEEKIKIPRDKFFTAIETLRKRDLIPTGQGKYVGKIAGQSFDF